MVDFFTGLISGSLSQFGMYFAAFASLMAFLMGIKLSKSIANFETAPSLIFGLIAGGITFFFTYQYWIAALITGIALLILGIVIVVAFPSTAIGAAHVVREYRR